MQSWKARVITVRSDQFAPMLNCKRSDEGIRHEIAFGLGLLAEVREDTPMSLPSDKANALRPVAQRSRKSQRLLDRVWMQEYTRMSDHPDEAAQHQI